MSAELGQRPDNFRYTGMDIRAHPTSKMVTVTTATAVAHDPFHFYQMVSPTAQTLTIPPSSIIPYDVGATITVLQMGQGAVTVVAGAGVTIMTAATSLVSKGQYNIIQLVNVGLDAWVAFGGVGG